MRHWPSVRTNNPVETGKTLRICRHRFRQHLHGYVALQLRVRRPVHLPHPTHTDLGGDLIRAEAGAGTQSQSCFIRKVRELERSGGGFSDGVVLFP